MNKSPKSPHDSLEIKCGSCEHDVDRVSEKPLVEIAPQEIITLAVSDNGFDARPFPEEFVFLCFRVGGIRSFRHIWDEYLSISRCLLSSVSSVASQVFHLAAIDAVNLLLGLVDRVPVILIAERKGSYDDTVPQSHDRHLVTKHILLVFLALAYAEDIRFMKRVNLMTVNELALDKRHTQFQMWAILAGSRQFPLQFPDKCSCYGTHSAISLGDLLLAVCLAPEALRKFQVLDFAGIALSNLGTFSTGHLVTVVDNLVQKLGICWLGYVLLLYGGVNECCLILIVLASTAALFVLLVLFLLLLVLDGKIDADALL